MQHERASHKCGSGRAGAGILGGTGTQAQEVRDRGTGVVLLMVGLMGLGWIDKWDFGAGGLGLGRVG